jgi:hypothetical protein
VPSVRRRLDISKVMHSWFTPGSTLEAEEFCPHGDRRLAPRSDAVTVTVVASGDGMTLRAFAKRGF